MAEAAAPVLRVARPCRDIAALLPFWRDGLGLSLLAGFEDHDGFDGVVLGHPGAPWHLELTRHDDHVPAPCPSPEHLLVLYRPDADEHAAAVRRMRGAGFAPVAASNPYWDRCGVTFADPEGWRAVLAARAWTA